MTDVCVDTCDTQVRADITLYQDDPVKIWGQIKDQCCRPVPNARLTLMKACVDSCGRCHFQTIMHTVSDCNGMYCFEVCRDGESSCYKVFAEKQSVCPAASDFNCGHAWGFCG